MTKPGKSPQSQHSQRSGHGLFAGFLRMGGRGQIRIAFTNVDSGSFDLASADDESRRRAITGLSSVSWLRQEHGTTVLTVAEANQGPIAGAPGDAVITNQADHAVSVITADCAPIALWTEGGVVGAVHAGWKGLEAGIIERTVDEMRSLSGESEVFGWLGPCIGAECYEFGEPELTRLVSRYGDSVRATTSTGSASLDMAAGVRAAFARAGASDPACRSVKSTVCPGDEVGPAAFHAGAHWAGSADACTACDEQWYSWRARKSAGRQALFVWRPSNGDQCPVPEEV
jgi:polyphenol oxidase